MFKLDNKVAVITGGGSGIGRAIATIFAQQGAKIYIIDVDEKGAEETVKAIVDASGEAAFKKCDISSKEQVDTVVGEIIAESGIDILVNNAGIAHIGNIEQVTPEAIDRLFCECKGYVPHYICCYSASEKERWCNIKYGFNSIAGRYNRSLCL
jgi:NAD(P)-dependent dehydrogenase (short-subunit alcohol dehydrogenase family)